MGRASERGRGGGGSEAVRQVPHCEGRFRVSRVRKESSGPGALGGRPTDRHKSRVVDFFDEFFFSAIPFKGTHLPRTPRATVPTYRTEPRERA